MTGYRLLKNIRVLLVAGISVGAIGAAAVHMAPSAAARGDKAKIKNTMPKRDGTAHAPGALLSVLGFSVSIDGAGSGGDVDSAWETISGGSLNIEVADSSVGTDATHTTTPGHKYVDTITLRGPLTAGRAAQGRGRQESAYEILENGAGKFKLEIDGLPIASANVESITIEDLVMDERELMTGADTEFRVFGPGDAHFGSITIRSRVGKDSKELYQWWLDASKGKDTGKGVRIAALKRDGSKARGYAFSECFLTSYSPLSTETYPGVAVEEITVQCTTVEFETAGTRKTMVQWITDAVQGKGWKRDVTVKEITKDGSDGRTFTYSDAFPTRYVFPAFSASGTGNLYEEIAMKPIRLELK